MMYDYIKNGDCLQLMKELPDKSCDIAFTSPPYNRERNDKYDFYDDAKNDYYSFLCQVIDELMRITKRHIFFNVQAQYYNKADIYKLIGAYADNIQQIIIWEKLNPMPANGNNITNAYEFFLVIGDEPLKANGTYVKNLIATAVNGDMPDEHKAVMKQDVADYFMRTYSKRDDVVIDPFMGTGTTAIATRKYKCHYIGFEISQKYIDIALDRLKSETNQMQIEDFI